MVWLYSLCVLGKCALREASPYSASSRHQEVGLDQSPAHCAAECVLWAMAIRGFSEVILLFFYLFFETYLYLCVGMCVCVCVCMCVCAFGSQNRVSGPLGVGVTFGFEQSSMGSGS